MCTVNKEFFYIGQHARRFSREHTQSSLFLYLLKPAFVFLHKKNRKTTQVCLHVLLFGLKLKLYLHVAFAKEEKEKDLLCSRENGMLCHGKPSGSVFTGVSCQCLCRICIYVRLQSVMSGALRGSHYFQIIFISLLQTFCSTLRNSLNLMLMQSVFLFFLLISHNSNTKKII